MPKYVTLMSLTDQGIRTIKDLPQRLAAGRKLVESTGGKLLDFYVVMGEWDYVAITEGPTDEAALTTLLALGSGGSVRTLTMKAFEMETVEPILEKLP